MTKQKVALAALALTLLAGCDQQTPTASKAIPKVTSTKCALDVMNGSQDKVVEVKTGRVDFRGWAVDSQSNTTPALLSVVLTNKNGKAFVFENATRTARPDVVKVHKQDAFLQSGFRLVADISGLEKDTYLISLHMPTADQLIICSSHKVLLVNSSAP